MRAGLRFASGDATIVRPDFGRVCPPMWDDRPTVIVGTGESLKGFDFASLGRSRYRVLAVKQAHRDLPFADACFGLDVAWPRWARAELIEVARRCELYIAQPDQEALAPPIPGAIYLRRLRAGDRFTKDPGAVEGMGNSGFGALNLALHKGARRIALLGFDYRGEHYDPAGYRGRANDTRYLAAWGDSYSRVSGYLAGLGVTVLNGSRASSIYAFPRMEPAEALARIEA